jgi:predicted nucleic acid-binding protein
VIVANFPVVLDACVLYPAVLRDTLLRAAERDLYLPYWSDAILAEMHRNLVADGRLGAERAAYLVAEMTRAFPDAAVTGYEPLVPAMRNDPKDRHVLAAAVKARAQVIVTANLRDFPAAALDGYDVEAKHPDQFLLDLLSIDPRAVAHLIREQLADVRAAGATMDRLLAALTRHAPDFVEALRPVLEATA